ncbi:putative cell division protein YtgP [Oxobacter pfennigii]|uniref:Putative cell division protein YtgP n=1 Tax=Oxobacter pfennigii TaxID=36849 RepID=A0A0P8YGX4_9CLOT|nr:polysaccharide biosynthesis protein [Oxobacter pfennigii]KPU46333.1 putative cell division protein YtgP [Oxobacter pfennigii]
MSKSSSATKGFAVLSAAGILNKVLSVLYVPILLQIIGEEGYGIYSAGYRIYVFIYVLTNSGFPIAISKLQAELLAHDDFRNARRSHRIARLLLTCYGLFMTVITVVFAGHITNAIGFDRSYRVILALAPTMLFSAISCTYRGYFNGHSDMKPTAMSQVIEQFLNVVLSLIFALLLKPYGLDWACAGATVGTTLGSLGSALYLNRAFKKDRNFLLRNTPDDLMTIRYRALAYRLLAYALPIAFNSVVVFGGDVVDLWNTNQRLIAAGFSSADAYIKYGVLSKYTQLLNVPLAITAALHIATIPTFSSTIALKNFKLLKDQISHTFRVSLLLSIPSAVGLGVLSKPVFLMLFGGEYVDGWYLMAIGSVVIILVSIVQVQAGILQSVNKTRLSTIAMLAGIFVKIFINYFLIAVPEVNIRGAVIGTIVCYIIAIFINFKYIKKFVPVGIKIKNQVGRPFLASAVMGVIAAASYKLFSMLTGLFMGAYISNALSTIIAIAIGALSYGLIMLKIGGIDIQDIKLMPYGSKIIKLIPKSFLNTERAQAEN